MNLDSAQFADLSGLRAVVTGSSSGIGRAIALELARGGADVLVHCRRSRAEAEQVADAIRQSGRAGPVYAADLSDPRPLELFASEAWNLLGQVDVLVNNAGADVLTGDERHMEFAEKLDLLYEVDVRATMLLSRLVGERMKQAGRGVILNVGWDKAGTGMEGDSGELFAASKNAVMGFTRSLALSLAPQVRVNCIAPGWIRTAWGESASQPWQDRVRRETPLERWGTPDDIAKAARFLVSPDASFITGQVINVNGGVVR